MPGKGSVLAYGDRDYIVNKKFFQGLQEKYDIKSPYLLVKKVIEAGNKNITDIMINEPNGFKMSFGLGYLCAIKFIPDKPAINWNETNKNGGKTWVFHSNLHTQGYSCRGSWFRVGRITNTSFNEVYRFKADKKLGLRISKEFREGKQLQELNTADFVEISRLENFYNKNWRNRNKQEDGSN